MGNQRSSRILDAIRKACPGIKIITKTIPFRNDDVPKFLRRLAEAEKAARESKLIVRGAV